MPVLRNGHPMRMSETVVQLTKKVIFPSDCWGESGCPALDRNSTFFSSFFIMYTLRVVVWVCLFVHAVLGMKECNGRSATYDESEGSRAVRDDIRVLRIWVVYFTGSSLEMQ